jgi:hypothetical protein
MRLKAGKIGRETHRSSQNVSDIERFSEHSARYQAATGDNDHRIVAAVDLGHKVIDQSIDIGPGKYFATH